MINLPQAFLKRAEKQLGNEYEAFVKSYEDERTYGLRVNLLKCAKVDFVEKMPFTLEQVPWADEGFYYPENERPGKHPFHEAGAYYIQEPSAMSAVTLLEPEPGEKILDLCAAPGGKSSQIAARMNGKGLLVSNEIIPDRARILAQNVERMGIRNCVVTNENAEKLEGRFLNFFDRILVDAPCSGEGMFRKDETAVAEWTEENVLMCAERQSGILDCAANMLRPGGVLVYSTCTFSEEENEKNIEAFLERHQDFKLETMERLWPHKLKGEGHFISRLVKSVDGPTAIYRAEKSELFYETSSKTKKNGKTGRDNSDGSRGRKGKYYDEDWDSKKNRKGKGRSEAVITLNEETLKDFLVNELGIKEEVSDEMFNSAVINVFGENVYLTPAEIGSISGLNVARPGLHIAVNKNNRLEPAHALAMSLRPFEVNKYINLTVDEAFKYQCGESVSCGEQDKGWTVLFTEDFSIGMGKASNSVVKNHYPKGLRIQK